MSKDERKEMIENIAERFTQMDDVDKATSRKLCRDKKCSRAGTPAL